MRNNIGLDSHNTNVKGAEAQARKNKAAETQTPETRNTEIKTVLLNKMDRKESEVSAKETDKTTRVFCLESEIKKIKIHIPLVELVKNPVYQKK
jgi:hypothetical protein